MSKPRIQPTGIENHFGVDEIIVSKTDRKGFITYANAVFQRVAGYSEEELLGQPHNLIRHPDMPRCVFKLLWETIEVGREIFAYVNNMAKNGNNYWVLAHITPSFDADGRIVGYHSNRRCPHPDAVRAVEPLYGLLLAEEKRHGNRDGMAAAYAVLERRLEADGQTYDEFVWSLIATHEVRS